MKALLQAELLKLRTTRTFAALAAAATVTSVLIAFLMALLTEPSAETVVEDVFASETASLFILILAIVGISGEWRHRTITSSLLAAPNRTRFLAAKTLAFAAAGVALSLAISLAVAIVGYLVLSLRDLPLPDIAELLSQYGRNAILAALLGALGVGIGALLRNQPTAIVFVLVMSFVIEPTVLFLLPELGRFGPFVSLPLGVQGVEGGALGLDEVTIFSGGVASLGMLAWIGVFFALAALLLHRRDVE